MAADNSISNIREEVRRIVPSGLDVTSVEFEGPTLVIYTKDFDKFSENANITKLLATGLKKRVDVRPDPSTMVQDTDSIEKMIRARLPEDEKEPSFDFDFDTGVVTVELANPGALVGKGGQQLNDIKKKYGDKFIITDVGYVAVVLLTYEGDDQTIDDVIKEFDLELVDDYFARSRAAREEFIAEYRAMKG